MHRRAIIAPSVQGWVLRHLISWVESRGIDEAPVDQTNVKVVYNIINNDAFTNNYPYQAGVSFVGNNDKIIQ